jgi:NADH:ubiquinone oxidoreductase subunit E
LIAILDEIQNIHGYLPADVLRIVSGWIVCVVYQLNIFPNLYKLPVEPIGGRL